MTQTDARFFPTFQAAPLLSQNDSSLPTSYHRLALKAEAVSASVCVCVHVPVCLCVRRRNQQFCSGLVSISNRAEVSL